MKKRDLLCGAMLCFAGGAMNAYTYTMRGGVIAAAQTANFLRMSLSISEGEWSKVFSYVVPVIGFMLATYVTKWMREKFFKEDDYKWKCCVLLMEIIVFFMLGFGTDDTPTSIVNLIISFFAAMQYCAFRSFGKNAPYATVFCTGNMRSLVDNVYEGTMHHEEESRHRIDGYILMLFSFALGAGVCNILCQRVGHFGIWLAALSLTLMLIFWSISVKRE